MAARLTGLTCPAWSTVSTGCWPLAAAALPAATTVPPTVVPRPATVAAVALVSVPAACQEAPLALVNASTAPWLAAAIAAPADPPAVPARHYAGRRPAPAGSPPPRDPPRTPAPRSGARAGPVIVAPNFQVRPSGEVNATASARPCAWPGRTATNVLPATASPAIEPEAPLLAGTVTGDQVPPPLVLLQTAVLVAISMVFPNAAVAVIGPTVPPRGAASLSWSGPSRRQLVPVAEVQTTGPPEAVRPAARNPVAVRRSTVTWSPAWDETPDDLSVQAVPVALVQTLFGPTATHRPEPPAISVAG